MKNFKAEFIFGFLLVVIIAMLVTPVSPYLIDAGIVLSFASALFIFFASISGTNSTPPLTFPVAILITTLFRLSLNVASARLILSQGYAGEVIHAFGAFLLQGQIIVGAVIFLLITIVNYLVITKGAARVSEVAARFMLDSLPGRQMSIDSDQRSGAINNEEASLRRDKLRSESELYGAMDGAMKFIQGDAIAGIIIAVVNAIGGILMGATKGIPLGAALSKYTILTIGDGLVSQIPALLCSVASGIIVTKARGDKTSLILYLATQFILDKSRLYIVSAVLFSVGLLPGIPKYPFFIIAAGIAFFAWKRKDMIVVDAVSKTQVKKIESNIKNTLIQLDGEVLYPLYSIKKDTYNQWWNAVREDCFERFSFYLPDFYVESSADLGYSYAGIIHERGIIWKGKLEGTGVYLASSAQSLKAMSFQTNSSRNHPFSGLKLVNINQNFNGEGLDFLQIVLLETASYFLANPETFITTVDIHKAINNFEEEQSGIISKGFQNNFLSTGKITVIVHSLIKEKIPFRELKNIFSAIGEFCSLNQITKEDEGQVSTDFVVSSIRKQFQKNLFSKANLNPVKFIAIDELIAESFKNISIVDGVPLISGFDQNKLIDNLQRIIKPLFERGIGGAILLVPSSIRSSVKTFISFHGFENLNVIGMEEMPTGLHLFRIGVWKNK